MKSSPKATFWYQLTPAVTYYRCTLPARYLPGKTCLPYHGDLADDGKDGVMFPRQEGAAIWSFSATRDRALIMAEMQEQGTPVFMEADDNYLTPVPYNFSNWKLRIQGSDGAHSFEGFKTILRFVDGAIVSTPFLADIYGRFNSNIHVCPNSVDPDDWPDNPPHQQDGILRIGWAASDSHRYDASLIGRALDWASRQENVEVVIFGIKPELLGYQFPYTHIGWTDSLEEYREKLSGIDLMLCPLKPSFWADGKSDVKALEGVMAGAAPVVSHVEAYKPWHDRTFTASTAKEFLKVVRHLCKHREEVRDLYETSRKYVLDERTIQRNVHKWRDALV